MLIRSASLEDLDSVARIEDEVFATEVYPRFFFRQAFDLWGDLLLVADVPGSGLVGYALGATSVEAELGWVLSAAVRPTHRGVGTGEALTSELLARMKRIGIREARLTVYPGNSSAIRLYERFGFRSTGEESDYFGSDEPRLLMRRHL